MSKSPQPVRITPKQHEVLDSLSRHSAFSQESARPAFGFDEVPAEKLVQHGILNKHYDSTYGATYWVRGKSEVATGTTVPAGFLVILHRDLTTPSGKSENFFLARAPYDGRGVTFQRLLRVWMQILGLRHKDLLGGSLGFELIAADSPVFHGDQVILDSPPSPLDSQAQATSSPRRSR
jgi:hypothetical protein